MDAVLLAFVTFLLGIGTNWATTRRTLALQYDADLRRDRLEVYGDLWSRLEVLAKYGRSSPQMSLVDAENLAADLKRWYYRKGGLYLSEQTRTDYFALQDALQHTIARKGPIDDDGFEFIRVRSSRLRTSLTRDVGTRKTLKLRGDPERPPLPSELGTYRRWSDKAEITLSPRRAPRIAGRPLRSPVTIRFGKEWAKMEWDNNAWAIRAVPSGEDEPQPRQILLEREQLVEGPKGWDDSKGEQPAPKTWERVRPPDDR